MTTGKENAGSLMRTKAGCRVDDAPGTGQAYRINYDRVVRYGWTVMDFVRALEPIVMARSSTEPFRNGDELHRFIMENRPYPHITVPELYRHFAGLLGIGRHR